MLICVMQQEGLEPSAYWFEASYSIQLSYYCEGVAIFTPLFVTEYRLHTEQPCFIKRTDTNGWS